MRASRSCHQSDVPQRRLGRRIPSGERHVPDVAQIFHPLQRRVERRSGEVPDLVEESGRRLELRGRLGSIADVVADLGALGIGKAPEPGVESWNIGVSVTGS